MVRGDEEKAASSMQRNSMAVWSSGELADGESVGQDQRRGQ